LVATALGLAATVFVAWHSWVPSEWTDEAATTTSALRSWLAFLTEVRQVDAVHAVYYAIMHVWMGLFGDSAFALRSFSAVCLGGAVTVTAFLGRRWLGPAEGIVAAVLLALLPRSTYAGVTGRSASLTMLLAAAATLLLLAALRDGRRSRWVAYVLVTALLVNAYLYAYLLLPAHGLLAWSFTRGAGGGDPKTGDRGRTATAWCLSAGVAALAGLPLALLSLSQSRQVAWLPRPGPRTWTQVVVDTTSPGNPFFATVLLLAAAIGAVSLARRGRAWTAATLLAWSLGPTLMLIAASFVHPDFSPRYVSFTMPGVALVAAAAVTLIRPAWVRAIALLLALLVVLPTWAAQRVEAANAGMHWNQVAARVHADLSPAQRNLMVYGPEFPSVGSTMSTNRIAAAYPQAFRGTVNLLSKPATTWREALWGGQTSPTHRVNAVRPTDRVIMLQSTGKPHWGGTFVQALQRRGFRVVSQAQVKGIVIRVFSR